MAVKKKWAWGGFVGGRLDVIGVDTGWGGFGQGSIARMPALFASRKECRRRYQDVRRVQVTLRGALLRHLR